MKVQSQLVKDPPDIGLLDFAFLPLPSVIHQRERKMTQQKFVGDAVTSLDVDGCGFEVVIKFGKYILEEETCKLL
jgi:hypothetical protein